MVFTSRSQAVSLALEIGAIVEASAGEEAALDPPRAARRCLSSGSSTTRDRHEAARVVRITHPFHPQCGREFELLAWHQAWGEDRVCFHDEHGRLRSVPAAWTNVVEPDPFVTLAAGRSAFRVADLLRLADLLGRLTP
jgi:uncharacterized protein DUF5372